MALLFSHARDNSNTQLKIFQVHPINKFLISQVFSLSKHYTKFKS